MYIINIGVVMGKPASLLVKQRNVTHCWYSNIKMTFVHNDFACVSKEHLLSKYLLVNFSNREKTFLLGKYLVFCCAGINNNIKHAPMRVKFALRASLLEKNITNIQENIDEFLEFYFVKTYKNQPWNFNEIHNPNLKLQAINDYLALLTPFELNLILDVRNKEFFKFN